MIHHGENLKRLLREKEITQKDFAKKLSISRVYLISLFDKRKIKNDYRTRIKKLLGTDLEYETKNYGELPVMQAEENSVGGNIVFVPLYVFGGFLTGYSDQIFMSKLQRFFLPGVTGEHYAFEVDGMSMHDFASPGDWAISSAQEAGDHFVRGRAYVLQTIDGLIIKYFDSIDGNEASFYSHNKEYGVTKVPLKSIKKAYFVTRVLKKV
jgi:hypothetical protein